MKDSVNTHIETLEKARPASAHQVSLSQQPQLPLQLPLKQHPQTQIQGESSPAQIGLDNLQLEGVLPTPIPSRIPNPLGT